MMYTISGTKCAKVYLVSLIFNPWVSVENKNLCQPTTSCYLKRSALEYKRCVFALEDYTGMKHLILFNCLLPVFIDFRLFVWISKLYALPDREIYLVYNLYSTKRVLPWPMTLARPTFLSYFLYQNYYNHFKP